MQRRQARLDGRDRRLPECRRHLHRMYHARISRQIHALYESAAGFSVVFGCCADVRPRHSRPAPLHPVVDEQGTQLAQADACLEGMSMVAFSWPDNANDDANDNANDTRREASSAVAEPYLSPSQAEEILQDLAGVFRQHNPAVGRHVVYPPEALDQAHQSMSDDA